MTVKTTWVPPAAALVGAHDRKDERVHIAILLTALRVELLHPLKANLGEQIGRADSATNECKGMI